MSATGSLRLCPPHSAAARLRRAGSAPAGRRPPPARCVPTPHAPPVLVGERADADVPGLLDDPWADESGPAAEALAAVAPQPAQPAAAAQPAPPAAAVPAPRAGVLVVDTEPWTTAPAQQPAPPAACAPGGAADDGAGEEDDDEPLPPVFPESSFFWEAGVDEVLSGDEARAAAAPSRPAAAVHPHPPQPQPLPALDAAPTAALALPASRWGWEAEEPGGASARAGVWPLGALFGWLFRWPAPAAARLSAALPWLMAGALLAASAAAGGSRSSQGGPRDAAAALAGALLQRALALPPTLLHVGLAALGVVGVRRGLEPLARWAHARWLGGGGDAARRRPFERSALSWLLLDVYRPAEAVAAAALCARLAAPFLPPAAASAAALCVRLAAVAAAARVLASWQQRFFAEALFSAEVQGRGPTAASRIEGASRLAGVLTTATALLLAAQQAGLDLNSLLAVGGISGLAVGLAGREILGNCFAGLVLFSSAHGRGGCVGGGWGGWVGGDGWGECYGTANAPSPHTSVSPSLPAQPFGTGDHVKFTHGSQRELVDGTVLDVGLFRTAVRSWEREVFYGAPSLGWRRAPPLALSPRRSPAPPPLCFRVPRSAQRAVLLLRAAQRLPQGPRVAVRGAARAQPAPPPGCAGGRAARRARPAQGRPPRHPLPPPPRLPQRAAAGRAGAAHLLLRRGGQPGPVRGRAGGPAAQPAADPGVARAARGAPAPRGGGGRAGWRGRRGRRGRGRSRSRRRAGGGGAQAGAARGRRRRGQAAAGVSEAVV